MIQCFFGHSTFAPVPGAALPVGDDLDNRRTKPIDNCERESAKQVASSRVQVSGPALGDNPDRPIKFRDERFCGLLASRGIPLYCRGSLLDGVGVDLDPVT